MSDKKTRVYDLCSTALDRIDQAIAKHERGEDEDLSVPVLKQVREEIEMMRLTLDSSKYQPGYARYLLDWPDKYGLVDFLLQASYQYKRNV